MSARQVDVIEFNFRQKVKYLAIDAEPATRRAVARAGRAAAREARSENSSAASSSGFGVVASLLSRLSGHTPWTRDGSLIAAPP